MKVRIISLVPGLGLPTERAALGHSKGDRGAAIDAIIPLLLRAHIDAGLSKFVLRPLSSAIDHWLEELHWLADTTLPLQKAN